MKTNAQAVSRVLRQAGLRPLNANEPRGTEGVRVSRDLTISIFYVGQNATRENRNAVVDVLQNAGFTLTFDENHITVTGRNKRV